MKKVLSITIILIMLFSSISVVLAQEASDSLTDKAIVEKYATVYDELESEAAELALKEGWNSNASDKDYICISEDNNLRVLTKTIEEEDEIVTVGIVYSRSITQNVPTELVTTHAKLYINSALSKRTTGNVYYYSLKKVSGRVVQFYDGATCSKISILAGQSMPGAGDRSDSFYVNTSYYSRNYSWPEIQWYPGVSNIGHSATFKIKRGNVTQDFLVQANL